MLNKMINKISVSSIIVCLIILFFIIAIAKSIYLILFLSLLNTYLIVNCNSSVKYLFNYLYNIKLLLLFATIIYIIFMGFNVSLLMSIYKLILILLLCYAFVDLLNFDQICSGVYTLLLKLKINTCLSTEISIIFSELLYGFKFLYVDYNKNKKRSNVFLHGRYLLTLINIVELNNSLRLKYYKPTKNKFFIKDRLIMLFFVILLLVAICKEGVL